MKTASVASARVPARTATDPPLQNRTPEQLKDGMVVKVSGAGAEDLAVARLIQDGASYVASTAGTTMGLKTVNINDRSIDSAGALGMATFYGNDGWFGLSQRSTKGLMEGITRLREMPYQKWTEAQRADFLQANETVLHEAGHVTLPGYDGDNIRAWRGADRSFEEGLTEITTMHQVGDFMKAEYGVDVPSLTDRISQSTSAYTRYTERITRMLEMGGSGSRDDTYKAAQLVADNTRADRRLRAIAERIGANLGGADAPKAMVDEIARTLPGFVAEQNGTRTRLMQIQSALVDFKGTQSFDERGFRSALRKIDRTYGLNAKTLAPRERNGDRPLD